MNVSRQADHFDAIVGPYGRAARFDVGNTQLAVAGAIDPIGRAREYQAEIRERQVFALELDRDVVLFQGDAVAVRGVQRQTDLLDRLGVLALPINGIVAAVVAVGLAIQGRVPMYGYMSSYSTHGNPLCDLPGATHSEHRDRYEERRVDDGDLGAVWREPAAPIVFADARDASGEVGMAQVVAGASWMLACCLLIKSRITT